MKIPRYTAFLLILTFLFSCKSYKNITAASEPDMRGLKLINVYVVPNDLMCKGTLVGGLSGIDYDSAKNIYYIISDDRSERNPARFYKAKISLSEKGIDSVWFEDVITLKDKKKKEFPSFAVDPAHAPDPESIRYKAKGDYWVWSSEGERQETADKTAYQDPAIFAMNKDGKSWPFLTLPSNFHVGPETKGKGPRRNGVFEGITFSEDYNKLYVSVEEPLFEDGPRAGTGDSTGTVRILIFNTHKRPSLLRQYYYTIDAIPFVPNPPGAFKVNGISEILSIGKGKLLVMERAYVTGRASNSIRLYIADLTEGANTPYPETGPVESRIIKHAPKSLLLNLDDLGITIDNVEGITFGPMLPNGHRSLILVSDNNFNDKQKTQFFLFDVMAHKIN